MARYRSFFTSLFRTNRVANRGERGQMLMLTGLLIPVLLGMAGLTVDVGLAAASRRDLQNAADSAALAGAGILHDRGTAEAARTAAFSWAQKNGLAASATTVNIPPQSGPHTGDSTYVEVLLHRERPTVFMRVLHVNTVTTDSRAVAKVSRNKNYALVVLNNTQCSSYDQSSGNTLTLIGGGMVVDSSCKPSGSQGGGSTLVSDFIEYYAPGSWSQSNNASSSTVPQPVSAPVADPLASLARPTPGTASPDSGGTAASPALLNITGSKTLHPGTYYGGIKISSSGTVTMLPGTYIFAGGGFTYSGSGAITGNGVMFFNTNDPAATKKGSGDCAGITMQGGGKVTLVAPASGTNANMLFWQDDACTQPLKYAGSTYLTVGIIYLPKAQLEVSGGGALGALQVVVDTFRYNGSTSVTIDCGRFINMGPIALVE